MKVFKILCFLCSIYLSAQTPYPQDYFRSPLDIQLVLSGTFAELRSNHFHSGLDIKTNGKQGLKVYAAAQGYVSRIKISRYGYGKALYITHPNGYTTVYAHLQKFSPEIEAYIKKQQYQRERFEIELFPKLNALKIESDALVAFSGNTGGSSGPHLHFEIRDKQERPINPMLFGLDIKDTTAPELYELYAYPISEYSHIDGVKKKKKIRLIKQPDGSFVAEAVKSFGEIGFGIVANDRQDYAPNKNGVSKIETYFNGQKSIKIDFKRFSFSETKHINRFIDYAHYRTKKIKIQKHWEEQGITTTNIKIQGFVKKWDGKETDDENWQQPKFSYFGIVKVNDKWVIQYWGRGKKMSSQTQKLQLSQLIMDRNDYFILRSNQTYYKIKPDQKKQDWVKKINEAIINLVLTKAIGPNSGVATLINMKALPQRAPKKVNSIQYLISILKR